MLHTTTILSRLAFKCLRFRFFFYIIIISDVHTYLELEIFLKADGKFSKLRVLTIVLVPLFFSLSGYLSGTQSSARC